MLCDALEGGIGERGAKLKREGICVYTELIAETSTTLQSHYTPIINVFKNWCFQLYRSLKGG